MQYLLTGIELHPDKGFGVTADAYYQSAKHLMTNHFEGYDATAQVEMPQNFLFRHSIELYLKSLIIIFHRKLKIDYGTASFDSEEPEIFSDGQWRKLYNSHFLDRLYNYWLNYLLLPNLDKLNKVADKGDWQESKIITDFFPLICKYDKDSSYFRYPITKNNLLDKEKYTMQQFKAKDVVGMVRELKEDTSAKRKGTVTLLIVDDDDNIIDAFKHNDNVLSNVRDALQEVSFYFYCFHAMTRATLCQGM